MKETPMSFIPEFEDFGTPEPTILRPTNPQSPSPSVVPAQVSSPPMARPPDSSASSASTLVIPINIHDLAKELEKKSLSDAQQKRGWFASKAKPVTINLNPNSVGPLNQGMFPMGRPAQVAIGQLRGTDGAALALNLAALTAGVGQQEAIKVLLWEATVASQIDVRLAMSDALTTQNLLEGWAEGLGDREYLEDCLLKEPKTGLLLLLAAHGYAKLAATEVHRVLQATRYASNLLFINTEPGLPSLSNPGLCEILLGAHAVLVPSFSDYASILDAARYIQACLAIGVRPSRLWLVATGGLIDQRQLPKEFWRQIAPNHLHKFAPAPPSVEHSQLSFKVPVLQDQSLCDAYRELLRKLLVNCRGEMASPSTLTNQQLQKLRSR